MRKSLNASLTLNASTSFAKLPNAELKAEHVNLVEEDGTPEDLLAFNEAIARIVALCSLRFVAPGVVEYPPDLGEARARAILDCLQTNPASREEFLRDMRMLEDLRDQIAAELKRDYPGDSHDRPIIH